VRRNEVRGIPAVVAGAASTVGIGFT